MTQALLSPSLLASLTKEELPEKENPIRELYEADTRGLPEALSIRDIRDPSTREEAGTARARNRG